MAKDFKELPFEWPEARVAIQDMLKELTREASIENMNGEKFTEVFVGAVAKVLTHKLGKAPVFLQVLSQSAHGSLVFSAATSTQVTVTSDVSMTATFRIE